MSAPPGGEPVGSAAEEAAKLLGAFASWAQESAEGAAHGGGQGAGQATHEPGSPECAWCPVCRGARWLRGTSPEVRDHLTTAAAALAQAATALLATVGEQPDGAPEQRRHVEHIDLDAEPDPEPENGPDPHPAEDAP